MANSNRNPKSDSEANDLLSPITRGMGDKYYDALLQASLDKLSRAKQTNVQEITASQLQLLNVYHTVVLDQAKRSFFWALVAAAIGLGFFVGSVGFILLTQSQGASLISLVSGALVEFISAINFYLYSRTAVQLASFQLSLDTTQRFLIANSICEGLEGDYKQKARSDLVRLIVQTTLVPNNSEIGPSTSLTSPKNIS